VNPSTDKENLLKRFAAIASMTLLTACVQEPLTEYRPVVDPSKTSAAKFESDLSVCRNIALQAEAEYKKRQDEEMGQNIMAGILVGAITGAIVGDSGNYAAAGAAYGAGAGVAATDTELAQGGPRRIIDRCMADRGHTILNDLGSG
jgi:hypothetical protein